MSDLFICYCDKCAKKNEFPIVEEKVKDSCAFCRFTGPVNKEVKENLVDMSDFNVDSWSGGGFRVLQKTPFPVKQSHDKLYPHLPRRMISDKCLIFYDKNFLIIANPKTGQQIQIDFYNGESTE